MLKKSLILIFSLVFLSACELFDTMKEGVQHAENISQQLEKSLGSKSTTGFNWNNGKLTAVQVTFESIPNGTPLPEIAKLTSEAVQSEFKQKPEKIIISFSIIP